MNSNKTGIPADVETLRAKLVSDFNFISSVLDRVPSMYWKDRTEDGNDEEEETEVVPGQVPKLSGNASKTSRVRSIEELQERLEAMKVEKKGFRELASRKNLKAKLKKKQKADERKFKLKQMRAEKQLLKQASNQSLKNGSVETVEAKPSKPVFNSEGKMVFSKFDFSEISSPNEVKNKKKELKDPKKILEKLKEKKEKLKKLKEDGQEAKVLEIKHKEAWTNALKKADGIKVKDDPELLKKAVKRQESQKKRSAKQWASRIHGVEKAKKERQSKRDANIQAKKDERKKNKKSKLIKKGRLIPGF